MSNHFYRRWAQRHKGYTLEVHEHPETEMFEPDGWECPDCGEEKNRRIKDLEEMTRKGRLAS